MNHRALRKRKNALGCFRLPNSQEQKSRALLLGLVMADQASSTAKFGHVGRAVTTCPPCGTLFTAQNGPKTRPKTQPTLKTLDWGLFPRSPTAHTRWGLRIEFCLNLWYHSSVIRQ